MKVYVVYLYKMKESHQTQIILNQKRSTGVDTKVEKYSPICISRRVIAEIQERY